MDEKHKYIITTRYKYFVKFFFLKKPFTLKNFLAID